MDNKNYIDGNKIVNTTFFGRVDVFQIVDEFPCGYQVWNIGRQNFPFPGYLPLGRFKNYQMENTTYYPLKAIKIEEKLADKVLKYATKTEDVTWDNYKKVFDNLNDGL